MGALGLRGRDVVTVSHACVASCLLGMGCNCRLSQDSRLHGNVIGVDWRARCGHLALIGVV